MQHPRHRAPRSSTWPRTATASAPGHGRAGHPHARSRHGRHASRTRSTIAHAIGYPVMVRPSYVLGGRGMEVVYDDETLSQLHGRRRGRSRRTVPILIDRFLTARARVRGRRHLRRRRTPSCPAVMEHVELAGIHSGDSACILPSRQHLRGAPGHHQGLYAQRIAEAMHVLRPHEHAVRHRGRHRLRARGQSAREPHRAARLQGLRYPDGAGRHRRHHRSDHRPSQPRSRAARAHVLALRRQGSRLPVQHVPRGRSHPRPRDALDR